MEAPIFQVGEETRHSVRSSDGDYCQFCIALERNISIEPTGRAVGIDVGLAKFYTASRLRREFAYRFSLLQAFALIRPFERFSHSAIEVIDEFKDASLELSFANEIGSSK